MNPEHRQLVNGYLDGMLTPEQEAELNTWLKAAPENPAAFAEIVRLHDRLHHEIATLATTKWQTTSPRVVYRYRKLRQQLVVAGSVVTVAVVAFFFLWSGNSSQVSASTELDRLIEKASDNSDRSYIIRNLDDQPEQPEERRPPIDGAALYIRPPDQYVLVRNFPDGRRFVTGCDGEKSWAVPPNGVVRVSGDPLRFRGPLPGNQHGIPFINLRSDLVQLRDAYVVTSLSSDRNGNNALLAIKKLAEFRGPNRVELWYDNATGVIQRMVFKGMPKARGGPDSVEVELLNRRELGKDFFQHQAHHDNSRQVVEED
ncbi:MAG: hypothetical protein R3B84_19840 [Zavarzinella sp.]